MNSRWLDPALSPHVSAYGAQPLTVAELDAHADGARIWATIVEARAEHEAEMPEVKDDGEHADADEPVSEEGAFDDFRDKVVAALDKFKKSFSVADLRALEAVINEG